MSYYTQRWSFFFVFWYILYRLNLHNKKANTIIERAPHSSYQPLLSYLKLETLLNRRKRLDLCFIFKLTNGYINCSELLSSLNFNIPNRRTRQLNTFYVQLQRSNYGKNAPMNRLMELVNFSNVDLFSIVSLNDFNFYLNNIFSV